jgi:hypothetical protein
MDSTLILAIVAFIIMFGLFVVVPTVVKKRHTDTEPE